MTVPNQTARTGPYNGNGSTTVFAYDFRILAQSHVVVTLKNASNVETVETLTTDYTVSGVGAATGGNITMVVAPATGEQVTFSRAVPQTQEVDLANRGGVQPEVLEGAYDKLTQLSQDKVELLNRMPRFPVSSALTEIELPLTLVADTALIVNAGGTGYTTGPTAAQISAAEAEAAAAAASAVSAAGEASAANPKYAFSTSTSMADPGAGILRYNHATVASVSAIAIDDQTADAGNPNIEDWLKSWDDSTSTIKGWLRLVEPGTPANYAVFHITGLTDSSGFVQLAVTHIDSNGTFGNGDSIRAMFSRTGDKGSTGDTGSTGSTGPAGPAIGGLLTTRGDIVTRSASEAVRFAVGSANTVLTTDGTDPAWSTVTNAMLAGSIDLASKVTGTLPLANGGTGATSLSGAGIAVLGANTFTGVQTFGAGFVTAKGADRSSATALVLGTDGNYFDVTGTTTVASMTVAAGSYFMLQFDGILTLTHGASLLLPTAANITTAAGDRLTAFATAANTVIVVGYTRADGTGLAGGGASRTFLERQVISSGVATVDLTTGTWSNYDFIDVQIADLVPATASHLRCRIRISSTFQTGATYDAAIMGYGGATGTPLSTGNVYNASSFCLTAPAGDDPKIATTTTSRNTFAFRLANPNGDGSKNATWQGSYTEGGADAAVCAGAGRWDGATGVVDGLRFYMETGNVNKMLVTSWGVNQT